LKNIDNHRASQEAQGGAGETGKMLRFMMALVKKSCAILPEIDRYFWPEHLGFTALLDKHKL